MLNKKKIMKKIIICCLLLFFCASIIFGVRNVLYFLVIMWLISVVFIFVFLGWEYFFGEISCDDPDEVVDHE